MFKQTSYLPAEGARVQHVQLPSIRHGPWGQPLLHDSSVSLVPSGLQPGFQKLRSSNHLEKSSSEQLSSLNARMFSPSRRESSITPSRLASLHSPAICRICRRASSGASKFLSQTSCKSESHERVSLRITSGIGRDADFFLNGHQPMSSAWVLHQ